MRQSAAGPDFNLKQNQVIELDDKLAKGLIKAGAAEKFVEKAASKPVPPNEHDRTETEKENLKKDEAAVKAAAKADGASSGLKAKADEIEAKDEANDEAGDEAGDEADDDKPPPPLDIPETKPKRGRRSNK